MSNAVKGSIVFNGLSNFFELGDHGMKLFSKFEHRVWFVNHGKYAWSRTSFVKFH